MKNKWLFKKISEILTVKQTLRNTKDLFLCVYDASQCVLVGGYTCAMHVYRGWGTISVSVLNFGVVCSRASLICCSVYSSLAGLHASAGKFSCLYLLLSCGTVEITDILYWVWLLYELKGPKVRLSGFAGNDFYLLSQLHTPRQML